METGAALFELAVFLPLMLIVLLFFARVLWPRIAEIRRSSGLYQGFARAVEMAQPFVAYSPNLGEVALRSDAEVMTELQKLRDVIGAAGPDLCTALIALSFDGSCVARVTYQRALQIGCPSGLPVGILNMAASMGRCDVAGGDAAPETLVTAFLWDPQRADLRKRTPVLLKRTDPVTVVREVEVVQLPSPSPSQTETPTVTPSATPTESPTQTPTATPAWTPSATPTSTPTQIPVVTLVVTGTPTPAASPTQTPAVSPARTPSATPTATPTATVAVTPTAVRTSTPVPSPTQTPTVSPARTPSATPTAVPSQSPAVTLTATRTPTRVASPSQTPTAAPTPIPPVTPPSAPPTPLMTPTGQATASGTRTPAPFAALARSENARGQV